MSYHRYKNKIEPNKFQYVPQRVRERFDDTDYSDRVILITVLHRIVEQESRYQRKNTVEKASGMLQKLEGDCEDQSVLLASLYRASGIRCLMARMTSGGGRNDHIGLMVEPPFSSVEQSCQRIREFYYEQFDTFAKTIASDQIEGDSWLFADPTHSAYIGDINNYKSKYLRNGSLDWIDLKWTQKI